MAIHITNLYGLRGAAALSQQNVAEVAKELGFMEMGLYNYPVECDTSGELKKRLDGITSALCSGDIVIFQSPSWNNISYDRALVNNIRLHREIKLAIFIHDVITMMFEGAPEENFGPLIEMYNMADLIIVPSERMLEFLRKKGMKVKKVLVQSMWDLPFSGELSVPEFQRRIIFSGNQNRFPFVMSWDYPVPLHWFSSEEFVPKSQNINYGGWKNTTELLLEYTKGGFGLVWEQTLRSDYYKHNQPHKLCTYLAAGIPVIMQKGLTHEHTIQQHGLGFVVESLKEASDIVKDISEDKYYQLVNKIKNISFLIRGGFFTKKLLIDTVNYLLLG